MHEASYGKIFRVTGPLCVCVCVGGGGGGGGGGSTGHRWIPLTKTSNAELWCFLWCAPEQKAEQTVQVLVIWDAMALIMTSLWWAKAF